MYHANLLPRPTWAEIDLGNLAENFASSRKFIGDRIKIMAVVKADAYGHGAVECARRLESAGADWFGVALAEEGVELREAGVRKLILCLGGFWPGQERFLLAYSLTPVIFRIDQARQLNDAARERGTIASVHVKIDTGMGRLGVRADEAAEFAREIKKLVGISVDGVMTHFAAADDLAQTEFTNQQISSFHSAVAALRSAGHSPAYIDLANSPGAVVHPAARGNMVRLGGILYGLGGDVLPGGVPKPELKPVLSLKSRIAAVKRGEPGETLGYGRTFTLTRPSSIAAIPIGYQDGYSRRLSNKGQMLVRGRFAPVVGRISMDWTLIDVTEIENVAVGDDVTLIGRDGDCAITAEEVAAAAETISYEITCSIDRRVHRRYMR